MNLEHKQMKTWQNVFENILGTQLKEYSVAICFFLIYITLFNKVCK